MTIFRSSLIDPAGLRYQFVSANEPDTIGVEALLEGDILVEVMMDQAGQTSVLFNGESRILEFDLTDLRLILDKCESELNAWRKRLMEPGQLWGDMK